MEYRDGKSGIECVKRNELLDQLTLCKSAANNYNSVGSQLVASQATYRVYENQRLHMMRFRLWYAITVACSTRERPHETAVGRAAGFARAGQRARRGQEQP